MVKARLSLVALIALLNAGLVLLWQNWHPQKFARFDENFDRITVENIGLKFLPVALIVALLIIPAIVLLWATFFTLNEKGQVPRGSCLYKVIRHYAPYKEVETEDGEKVYVANMPEEVRFCPTYYKLVGAAFLTFGIFVSIPVVLIGIPLKIYKELTDGRPSYWDFSLNVGQGLLAVLAFFAGVVVLVGVVTLLVKMWPRFKGSFIGQWIAAVYDKACVKWQVEPEPASN